jgi:uncharacterized membrane protein
MSEKTLDLFKALVILVISIIVVGALVEDAFGIADAAKKIFIGIGSIGVIVAIYKTGIHRIYFKG